MVKSDGSHVWRRFAKDAGEIAQLAQILGQLEELKGTLLLHANEDGAPAETIAQLHMLVQQAHIILQAMVTGEEADTAAVEAPAGTADKRVLAAFGKTGARNSAADLPTMPANYTKKRRIDSIKTDPSSHILAFTQIGDRFLWRSAPTDVPNATPPTTATLQTLSVPPGVSVDALITAQYGGVSTIVNIALWSPLGAQPGANLGTNNISAAVGQYCITTNTASQINVVSSSATGGLTNITFGWTDTRGNSIDDPSFFRAAFDATSRFVNIRGA
jgi:hypothetical protein